MAGQSVLHDEEEIDMEEVVALLKTLEKHCSRAEFNTLCHCLTLERLNDHPDFADWSVAKVRGQHIVHPGTAPLRVGRRFVAS
jgi:hypothetical protein